MRLAFRKKPKRPGPQATPLTEAPLLHAAAAAGDAGAVEQLLQAATAAGSVQRLLAAPDDDMQTALHLAAANGHLEVTQQLLAAGAPATEAETVGQGPLHAAARAGHGAVVQLLLEAGADPSAGWGMVGPPLLAASCGQHASVIQQLLDAGADPNGAHYNGTTALHEAAGAGDSSTVRLLLAAGADTSTVERQRGDTPLHRAVRQQHAEVTRMLMRSFPTSAAAFAAATRENDVCTYLAQEGDRTWRAAADGLPHGRTALELALTSAQPAVMQPLLAACRGELHGSDLFKRHLRAAVTTAAGAGILPSSTEAFAVLNSILEPLRGVLIAAHLLLDVARSQAASVSGFEVAARPSDSYTPSIHNPWQTAAADQPAVTPADPRLATHQRAIGMCLRAAGEASGFEASRIVPDVQAFMPDWNSLARDATGWLEVPDSAVGPASRLYVSALASAWLDAAAEVEDMPVPAQQHVVQQMILCAVDAATQQ